MEPFYPHRSTAVTGSTGRKISRGFTLLELLVVFAIIVIVMGVVFTSQNTFNKTIILSNTAYDIALSLRDAETYGLGSRMVNSNVTNVGYGIHFQTGSSFLLFADTVGGPSCANMPPDCTTGDYGYSSGDTIIGQPYQINNGISITNFCAGASCASTGLASLDIVFERPNSTPRVNGSYGSACITITAPQAPLTPRVISIGTSGAINANAASCP